jgi:hypothetical protein
MRGRAHEATLVTPQALEQGSVDTGSMLVLLVSLAYLVATMAVAVYVVCDGQVRISLFVFVALWLRELLLLAVIAVVLLISASVKVRNVVMAWLEHR